MTKDSNLNISSSIVLQKCDVIENTLSLVLQFEYFLIVTMNQIQQMHVM